MTRAPWEILSSENVLDHPWYVVRRDVVRFPDGSVEDYLVSVRPEVVAVFPVTGDGRVVLVRQYKHAARQETLEFPAGQFRGEAPEDAARRELAEETGYVPARLVPLGRCFTDPSKNTNRLHMFLALGCEPTAHRHLDASEAASGLEAETLPLEAVIRALDEGDIQTMSSVVTGYRALRALDTLRA